MICFRLDSSEFFLLILSASSSFDGDSHSLPEALALCLDAGFAKWSDPRVDAKSPDCGGFINPLMDGSTR
jgi:hypothetical protein